MFRYIEPILQLCFLCTLILCGTACADSITAQLDIALHNWTPGVLQIKPINNFYSDRVKFKLVLITNAGQTVEKSLNELGTDRIEADYHLLITGDFYDDVPFQIVCPNGRYVQFRANLFPRGVPVVVVTARKIKDTDFYLLGSKEEAVPIDNIDMLYDTIDIKACPPL